MTITADADYVAVELAQLLITQGFGDAFTVTQRTSGTYNVATGTASVTNAVYTTTGKLVDYKAYQIDGNMVLKGDRKAILIGKASAWSPSLYIPNPGDIITKGSAIWNIINVNVIQLQGVTLAVICQVRGSSRG